MHDSPVFLTPGQIEKLRCVLTPPIQIYPSPPTSSFPILSIVPTDFLKNILFELKQHSIEISSVRLNGGAASYVLINDKNFVYCDIDILFYVKTPLASQQQTTLFSSNNEPYLCDVWTIIKYIISSCLLKYMSSNPTTYTQYFVSSVLDTYTKKNIQINSEQDSWALLSLQNIFGRNLELKFLENLKRQWQFSVDSFQIDLKPLLDSNHSQARNSRMNSLVIHAINSLTIKKKDEQNQQNTSTSPLQFGFFTPSSSPNINTNDNNLQCQTLTAITTIETSNDNNNETSEYQSRSSKSSESKDNDVQLNSPIQFPFSLNEDVDDGIEVDADDLNTDDDDQVFSSSTMDISITVPMLIQVYSVYNDLQKALSHLNNKLIATYEPETIRGGGLLKYCDLLARNYKPYDLGIMQHMQRYMCSRFFIDYKTIREQLYVISQYVATHYLPLAVTNDTPLNTNPNEIFYRHQCQQAQLKNLNYDSDKIAQTNLVNAILCLSFFDYLIDIVQHSTVCLTHEDRQLLLINLHRLKDRYHFEYDYLLMYDAVHYQKYHVYHPRHYANSSSNSSRSSSPSSHSSKSYGYHHRGNNQRNIHSQRYSNNASYHGPRAHVNRQTVNQQNQS